MKRNRSLVVKSLIVLSVLVLSALIPFSIALAAPLGQGAPVTDLNSLVLEFASLAGVGGLVAFVINALKQFNVVRDGQAPTWSVGINVGLLIVLYGLKVFAPSVDVLKLDGVAASLAQIGIIILGLVTQLGGTKVANSAVRGSPFIGYSHTLNNK